MNIDHLPAIGLLTAAALFAASGATAATFKVAVGDAQGGTQWELGTAFKINNITPFSPTVGVLTLPYVTLSPDDAKKLTQGDVGKATTEVWPKYYKSIGGKDKLDKALKMLGR